MERANIIKKTNILMMIGFVAILKVIIAVIGQITMIVVKNMWKGIEKMNEYLVIITTVLVITQVIRVTQNAISLYRNKVLFKKQVGELAEMEVKKEDFEIQRKAYRLIVDRLQKEGSNNGET